MRAAIVGGGVIGLACAFELARRGVDVTLLEREAPGAGASWVAAGMLAPSSELEKTPQALVELQLDSLRRYHGFVAAVESAAGQSCAYRDDGTLWVSRHRDDELELDHLCTIQQDRGMPARRLSGREVRQIEPYVSPRAIGGLLVARDTQVDPRRLVPALRAACAASGVEIRTHSVVRAVEPCGGVLSLTIEHGASESQLQTDQVLLASGVWLEDGIVTPLPTLGMRPIKGQIVHLRGQPLADRVLRNSDIYLVPRADGELLLGATEEEQGFDLAPSAGGTLDLLRYAFEVLPGIYDLELTEIDVGLRPAFSDHMPLLGPTNVDGVFAAAGHYRGGILLAPATAHWIAESMISGQALDELAPFGIERLLQRQGALA